MCETYDLPKSQCGSGVCFFSRFRSSSRNAKKDQGRDIPPNAEPAASPRRLQLGQLASTLPPPTGQSHGGQRMGGRDALPHMVLQPDFRKVSGISTEIFRQLESVENDHDATTAAALGAVERRGEMLVRMLDPRQFSRPAQDAVRKFLSMQDGLHSVHFVEIVKRPGQTLGLYIREGNGLDRYDGVFISRIAIESAVFNSGCLGVGDEILAVNLVDVTHMSLDDVVILMSIPRRLVLTIRQRKGRMLSHSQSLLRSESKPVVVIKKELEHDDQQYDENNDENGHTFGQYGTLGHSYPRGPSPGPGQLHHSLGGYSGIGRGRAPTTPQHLTPGQRLFGASQSHAMGPRSGTLSALQQQQALGGYHASQQPSSIQSLPRHMSYQPYATVGMQQLPDVTDYTRVPSRHDDYSRIETPQPPMRRGPYSDYYDGRPEPPPRPSSQQSAYQPYEWYRTAETEPDRTASISYRPPPPVITEQPRSSIVPQHFQPFDRAYPKTLESLAEKVHTFHTGPRPSKQNGPGRMRMPRTGSDHRITLGRAGDQQNWYGSMPRQRTTPDYGGRPGGLPHSARYTAGLGGRLSIPSRRKGPVDYASDSETMSYAPSLRSSAGLSLPASTRRSLGLTNGRSNSLPRDLIRGRGGRKHNVRFDRRGVSDVTSAAAAGRRALLLASGMDSQDESDGAVSAPEMPLTPRRERAEYRAWMTRAPSTSAIYERLKTSRDSDLLQAQKAAKFTFSAENLSILDRARNDQPYYSYRSHLMGMPGGDSTLARALAGRSPSTTSALAALGIREPPPSVPSAMKESLSSEPLRRLVSGMTPSRSRDLIASLQQHHAAGRESDRQSLSGRTSPASALLHRIAVEKDESLLRKEILSRSLIGRDLLSRESLKDDLLGENKSEKIASRLSAVVSGGVGHGGPGVGAGGAAAAALLAGRLSGAKPIASYGHLGGMSTGAPTGQPGGGGGGGSAGTGVMSGTPSSSVTGDSSRLKLLTINPSEFLRYKIERPSSATGDIPGSSLGSGVGHSGILRVHLLAGRALRSTVRSTDSSIRTRDLYCVLECDRVHKARTVVCTGDQNFDWDEIFELDLVSNKELDFLIYSWDPQLRHRLCYKGSVNLIQVLGDGSNPVVHQLAIKVEPRGTLYVKLKHTPPEEAFKREIKSLGLFGANVANVVMKEDSGLNVPLIVQRCIEEIERRGLDIIGLYRLCGSATKKQTLREAFERNPRTVDLSAENVPDINVITGVLKDYLRELPEPLLTKCLYQMLVDALGVCLPDDPEGNARLLFSIIECLPKPNRCTLLLILEHLSLVCSLSDRNKMGPTQLAQCFGPILMIQFDNTPESTDFQPPIKVLQYLLEVWPAKSVRGAGAEAVTRKGPSLLGKGRPFPRSSPASILSRSQKTSMKTSLRLESPSKGSPGGSLSESSPSPTSIHSKASIPPGGSHQQSGGGTATSVTTSTSGALTLTPSTTSSSLTSVTTPNSLTPVGPQAKSLIPATTSSNYSLTSEFSTTSVTSPTPSMPPSASIAKSIDSAGSGDVPSSQSSEDVFANVNVRNRVNVFELPEDDEEPAQNIMPNGSAIKEQSQQQAMNGASAQHPQPQFQQHIFQEQQIPRLQQQHQPPPQPMQQSGPVPPSPFPMRKLSHPITAPGRAERADSLEDMSTTTSSSSNNSISSKRKLPPLPQSFAHPDMMKMVPQSENNLSQPQQYSMPDQSQVQQQQNIRQQEHEQEEEDDDEEENDRNHANLFGFCSVKPSSDKFASGSSSKPTNGMHSSGSNNGMRPPQTCEDPLLQKEILPPSYSTACDMQMSPSLGTTTNGKPIRPSPVPPVPPPKPGGSVRQRLSSSDEEYGSPTHSEDGSRPKSNGVTGNGGSSSSSSTTPTTTQSQIAQGGGGAGAGGSKGSTPGTTTPLGTPPPVPPRLERRPSQPSPSSSPPSMPPPVPPRLGRAAPVRTPSLDGREAFEVDCYTIKEENGEEDFLT
ncbi:unnamed protein product [Orchesella dallaii]|uniref:Rho GTPase-activating protein 100F n=1 Tax=Orchesella dallaii TaxID=48710 RepID=A0ABP1QAB5_9HEXA